jgi:tetratricopeptide (TPR) repeat protein
MGRHDEGANIRRELVADYPDSAKSWLSLGLSLRSVGLSEECVTAFRRAAALNPALGEAWWALANLKTFRLSPHDIEQMQGQLADPALLADNRIYFHYALGKAFADDERWDKSFENYAKANALARIGGAYDADQTAARLERFGKTFTADFFGGRAEWGNSAADPIFIVGMQRSGSTLVEQILASHSAVEALGELPNIALVARQLHGPTEPDYFNAIGNLTADAARRMGEEYLAATCDRRMRGRPFFTDKQPYNFWHAGLIRLMLPNARVIDVRRHPMACCVSNFTQHYATRSTQFTHRLADMGHYYRCYAELMAHLNAAQPGTIHTVIYERLIAEPEKEIRRLLDYLGLPFEPSCLRFHETGRNLDSVSSEQVRQPIYADAVALWRNYEPWLQPLKTALGPVLDSWLTVS